MSLDSHARVLPRNDCRARRGFRVLLGAVAGFVCLQLGLSVAMDGWLYKLRDPEYGWKLGLLRQRLSERPRHALTLVLGSSRSLLGIAPEKFEKRFLPDGREELMFNFAVTGCGPVQELQMLKRLLRDGVRPDRVLVEMHPLLLHQEDGFGEEVWMEPRRLAARDLLLVKDYVFRPRDFVWRWLRGRLAPWHCNRFLILDCVARDWLDEHTATTIHPGRGFTEYGWLPFPANTPEQRRRGTATAMREYAAMLNGYRVTKPADRALQNLLEICRAGRIQAALFVMPEGSEFRASYTPEARTHFNNYLRRLSMQFALPVYDATDWCGDDDFLDSHHLSREGAAEFTQRFGQRAVADFLARSAPGRLR